MSAAAAVINPMQVEQDFVQSKVQQQTRSGQSCTELIFDWDDTLLPSTWLVKQGLRLDFPEVLPESARVTLRRIEEGIIALLTKAKSYGKVIIITNAETGWVELSAQRFVPGVIPYLKDIKVLSARSTFESQYQEPFEWKVAAFRQEVGAFMEEVDERESHDREQMSPETTGPTRHVVSFGDSVHERDAVWLVCKNATNTFTKSIKFVERPTAEQLYKEIDLVTNCMDYISTFGGSLDLMLTISLLKDDEDQGDVSPASSDNEDIGRAL